MLSHLGSPLNTLTPVLSPVFLTTSRKHSNKNLHVDSKHLMEGEKEHIQSKQWCLSVTTKFLYWSKNIWKDIQILSSNKYLNCTTGGLFFLSLSLQKHCQHHKSLC